VARIRTIKPEFPQSQTLGRCSRDARLLFILSWTICDDLGRCRAAAPLLKGLLYPYDDLACTEIDKWLAELERVGSIVLYEIEGSRYLQVKNWSLHQRIDKPSGPKLPEFVEGSRVFPEGSRGLPVGSGPPEGPRPGPGPGEGKGKEGNGEGNQRNRDSRTDATANAAANAALMSFPKSREWNQFKHRYPKRAGGQRPGEAAATQWQARIAEGYTAVQMFDGMQRYKAYLTATNEEGTQYVILSQNFLGNEKRFLLPWDLPKTKAGARLAGNVEAAKEFMLRTDSQK
jgi:hypothetical protein